MTSNTAKESTNDDSKAEESPIDVRDMIGQKEQELSDTISTLFVQLQDMENQTQEQIKEIEQAFGVFSQQLQERKSTLIQDLNQITLDKKSMLMNQCVYFQELQKTLQKEKASESPNPSVSELALTLITEPKIEVNIDAQGNAERIAQIVHVNNMFPPKPPQIEVSEVKAHTCKVRFNVGAEPYDGFQNASQHIVEVVEGAPATTDEKNQNTSENESDVKSSGDGSFDENDPSLQWRQVADRSNKKFARLTKLRPGTTYYARVKCKNDYGWSGYSPAVAFTTVILKIDTKIMTSDEIQSLIDAILAKRNKTEIHWTLLYRGSEDGFTSTEFHQKCDGIPETVVIAESDYGNVFGGFTRLPWKSDVGRYHVDEDAFVFLLRKKKRTLREARVFIQYKSSQHSVCHNKYMGPIFGYGHDIYIRSNCDKVQDNSCRNHTYRCDYAAQLGGKEKFCVPNYEVFAIRHEKEALPEIPQTGASAIAAAAMANANESGNTDSPLNEEPANASET